mgnify:CR=1 FL=1
MIALRFKELKSKRYSIYLDIFTSDKQGNRKRQYEFLKLYVGKDYSKIKNIAQEDKNTMFLAEDIRKKRELEIIGELKGIKSNRKTNKQSVLEYINNCYHRTKYRNLKTLLFHLVKFAEGKDILFENVTPAWIEKFKNYLEQRISINTLVNNLKLFRAKLNDAFREEIIQVNPFDKFTLPKMQETEKITLSPKEIEQLIKTPFPSHPHLRLAFLFSCFTGLRVSDIINLKWEDIKYNQEGYEQRTAEIQITPVKTKKRSGAKLRIPITNSAMAILESLKNEGVTKEKVFYDFPEVRYARDLIKLWAAKAGIKKNLHFHAGRHSFATISLSSGIDIFTVSKLLGHKSLTSTEVYAKIVDEKKRQEIKKLPIL